jgi:cation diffusion facilitator family transporter
MILAAGSFIIYSAIQRIITSVPIQPEEGMIVMLISILASYFLSRHLRKVATATGSLAIEASSRNIRADVYSAAGVLLGLLLVRITGLTILDPIIALIMASLVIKAGIEVLIKSFHELADSELPKKEQLILAACIEEHNTRLVNFHALRSRRSGNNRFIDLHLTMQRNLSVEDAHALCDHLESDIRQRLPQTDITIHIEPCTDAECHKCHIVDCDLRKL